MTKNITINSILPNIDSPIDYTHEILPKSTNLEYLIDEAIEIEDEKSSLMAVGGGTIIDYVKVISSFSKSDYIAIPTNASHDGFSSPYINFTLREQLLAQSQKKGGKAYTPTSPLAIIGDTTLISKAPPISLSAGVGDILAKRVAVLDWRLAHRLKGSKFDIYAATFAEMTANMVEDEVRSLKKLFFSEQGARVLIKALGSSGVAMCIAGSSRPASGSEHLVSHALDKLTKINNLNLNIAHGHQTGFASILMMYLHGEDWKRTRDLLKEVNAPVTLGELGIDRDLMLNALNEAQKIRPSRYTILSEGLTKSAAENAIEMTGID